MILNLKRYISLEFRMFNSTLHAGEVKSYIQLCLATSHQALIQQRAMRTRTHSENEKYTFRTWLLRLGLIGDLWYEQREDVLRTYTDTFPERVPLEQNKEFKSIRNAVIQEALKITPYFQQWADAGQRLRTEEEQPLSESQSSRENGFSPPLLLHQQKETDDGDDDSTILEEQRPANMIDESEKMNPVEPVYIPGVALSVSTLMAQLARLFQEQDQQRDRNQHQQVDRKQRREIDEKKQAMGIRD